MLRDPRHGQQVRQGAGRLLALGLVTTPSCHGCRDTVSHCVYLMAGSLPHTLTLLVLGSPRYRPCFFASMPRDSWHSLKKATSNASADFPRGHRLPSGCTLSGQIQSQGLPPRPRLPLCPLARCAQDGCCLTLSRHSSETRTLGSVPRRAPRLVCQALWGSLHWH